MKYLSNAFSFQMLKGNEGVLRWREIERDYFEERIQEAYSCVGHTDLANILGVKYNREPICLHNHDILYLCQLVGGRLPLGATELPNDCKFKYLEIENIGGI